MKTVEQQGLQAIQRSRELLIQERTALSNHIRGLLMEFGVVIPREFASLHRHLPEILEDGENGVPDLYRPALNLMCGRLVTLRADIDTLNEQIDALVKQNAACERLTRIEGIGPIGSVLLYATLGTGKCFHEWPPIFRLSGSNAEAVQQRRQDDADRHQPVCS